MEVEKTEVFIKNKTIAGFAISNITAGENRLRKAVSSLDVDTVSVLWQRYFCRETESDNLFKGHM